MLAPPEKRLGRANENRKEQIVFSTFPIKQKSGFALLIAHLEVVPMKFQTVRADRVLEIMPALHGGLQVERQCGFLWPEESTQHIQPFGGVQLVGGGIEP